MLSPGARKRGQASWDDLLDVPEEYIGEIIDGELMMTPRPAPPHIKCSSRLGAMLTYPFDLGIGGPGGWVILDEPRVAFGQDIRVPDLAGWRNERYLAPESGPYTAVPDWICEVLSPSTMHIDRGRKLDLYLLHGVKHVWLLDPLAATLEIFRAHEQAWLRVKAFTRDSGEPSTVRAEPFDAVELDLALLWGMPAQTENPDI